MMRLSHIYHRYMSGGIYGPLYCNISFVRGASVKYMSSSVDFEENLEKVFTDDEIQLVKAAQDRNILYSSYMSRRAGIGSAYKEGLFLRKKAHKYKIIQEKRRQPLPLVVEKMLDLNETDEEEETMDTPQQSENSRLNLPYSKVENINADELKAELDKMASNYDENKRLSLRDEIAKRMQEYEKRKLRDINSPNEGKKEAAMEELYFNESILDVPYSEDRFRPKEILEGKASENMLWEELDDLTNLAEEDLMEYGTSDASIPITHIPCGGCGALLHCHDSGLPGFLPKEVFEGRNSGELKTKVCQRCYFLDRHNTALNVRVSPQIYEKLLEPIKDKMAMVMVVVDLLDVPCSIWPNIINIVGTRRPVVVVGNKVDLLPADGYHHLKRVKESLISAINATSLGRANIKHVTLVSASTGYGIESLITKIQKSWGIKGDIYIVGCTNSGKSTLFNALLGSDLCKTQASDRIRRATTSPWPGTTLNMLKFPILRPSGYRLYLRTMRLKEERQDYKLTKMKQFTKNTSLATVAGSIGRTFAYSDSDELSDPFSIKVTKIPQESTNLLGIKETENMYANSRWCYDTPGTIQPDQMIHLLTHEELMKVLPKKLIQPRSFSLTSGKSLFIGGLARLDVLYSEKSVKLTVFSSSDIPLMVVRTVSASALYRNYLGSSFLEVPVGDEERLRHWPVLAPCDVRMTSIDRMMACGDVILSSAGWVTVTAEKNQVIEMRGWTPGGRGIYLRTPSMLPHIASLRGRRVGKSPAYRPHKLMIPVVNESY